MFDLNNSVCFRLLNFVGYLRTGDMRECSGAKSRTRIANPKKHIPRIYFFTYSFRGSASVPARAGPQKLFCTNCKRVLRASFLRGLLELLLHPVGPYSIASVLKSLRPENQIGRSGCEG